MTEELTFKIAHDSRSKYTIYHLDHDTNSISLNIKCLQGSYVDYEIVSTITINVDIPDREILDKIEKEAMKLFKEAYNFSTRKNAYKLMAIVLLLLSRYKVIKYRQLTNSHIIKISYNVITRRKYKQTYQINPRNFRNLLRKLDKFFKENKLYEKTE
jgi:hypothetical protein